MLNTRHPLSTKVGPNFGEKLRLLGRYSSLADSSHEERVVFIYLQCIRHNNICFTKHIYKKILMKSTAEQFCKLSMDLWPCIYQVLSSYLVHTSAGLCAVMVDPSMGLLIQLMGSFWVSSRTVDFLHAPPCHLGGSNFFTDLSLCLWYCIIHTHSCMPGRVDGQIAILYISHKVHFKIEITCLHWACYITRSLTSLYILAKCIIYDC
jgi:hypothetical protein